MTHELPKDGGHHLLRPAGTERPTEIVGTGILARAVQHPVQQAYAEGHKALQAEPAIPGFSESCGPLQFLATPPVAAVGVEPTTRGL